MQPHWGCRVVCSAASSSSLRCARRAENGRRRTEGAQKERATAGSLLLGVTEYSARPATLSNPQDCKLPPYLGRRRCSRPGVWAPAPGRSAASAPPPAAARQASSCALVRFGAQRAGQPCAHAVSEARHMRREAVVALSLAPLKGLRRAAGVERYERRAAGLARSRREGKDAPVAPGRTCCSSRRRMPSCWQMSLAQAMASTEAPDAAPKMPAQGNTPCAQARGGAGGGGWEREGARAGRGV